MVHAPWMVAWTRGLTAVIGAYPHWLNRDQFDNFQSTDRVAAVPYGLVFQTAEE